MESLSQTTATPPNIPWDGQRAAVARVAYYFVRSNGKYQGQWGNNAANLAEQKGKCPFRQRTGTLLAFPMKIDQGALALGAAA
eukprot:5512013-Pyramimonas_sp.AAC.1